MADGQSLDRIERRIEAAPRPNWFSDLEFGWGYIIVRKTGVKITPKELTLKELAKFFTYLGVILAQGAWVRATQKRRYKVFFTPARPRPWYVVWSALTRGGVGIAKSEEEADAGFWFEDVTVGMPPRLGLKLLNAGLADISKTNVARAFGEVFGYPLLLDPTTHHGEAVEKGEGNGTHDGRLVTCPTAALPGRSYQRFIDSSDGETAFDYRTTIINRKPLFVLVKTKPAADRFSIHNATVKYRPLEAVFSPQETEQIARFGETMQIDWGAIDVLRDAPTGRIYIVDVNKTDTGPAVDLSLSDREKLKTAISRAFLDMVRESAGAASGGPVRSG